MLQELYRKHLELIYSHSNATRNKEVIACLWWLRHLVYWYNMMFRHLACLISLYHITVSSQVLNDICLVSSNLSSQVLNDICLISSNLSSQVLNDICFVSSNLSSQVLNDICLVSSNLSSHVLNDICLVSSNLSSQVWNDICLVSSNLTSQVLNDICFLSPNLSSQVLNDICLVSSNWLNHTRILSCNQPVLSISGKVSSSSKQRTTENVQVCLISWFVTSVFIASLLCYPLNNTTYSWSTFSKLVRLSHIEQDHVTGIVFFHLPIFSPQQFHSSFFHLNIITEVVYTNVIPRNKLVYAIVTYVKPCYHLQPSACFSSIPTLYQQTYPIIKHQLIVSLSMT